jgi:hypothetical protein
VEYCSFGVSAEDDIVIISSADEYAGSVSSKNQMKALTSNRETIHGIWDGKLAKKMKKVKRNGTTQTWTCHPHLPSHVHDIRRDPRMPTMRAMMKLRCLKLVPYKTGLNTQKVAFQLNNDFEAT